MLACFPNLLLPSRTVHRFFLTQIWQLCCLVCSVTIVTPSSIKGKTKEGRIVFPLLIRGDPAPRVRRLSQISVMGGGACHEGLFEGRTARGGLKILVEGYSPPRA